MTRLAHTLMASLVALAVSAPAAFGEARDDEDNFTRKQAPVQKIRKTPPPDEAAPRPLKKPISVNKQDRLDATEAEPEPEPEPAPESKVAKPATASNSGEVVTIVVTGDTGFSRNHSPVHPGGVLKYGRRQPFSEAMSRIAGEVNGDLNFTNIETIVTDHNRLKRDKKGQKGPFNFRSHPKSIQHLVDRGFNLMSLVNNHSMDYHVAGLKETLRHMNPMLKKGLLAHAGIGLNREEASRPQMVKVKGTDVAFSAIGIATNNLKRHRAGKNTPGQIAYRFDDDYRLSVKRLADTKAGYRILSIHYGIEGRVRTDAKQIKEWRGMAARQAGIDLIIGHHAHVPRAVERAGDSVIFYGLGNFLHHGTANMSKKGICKDFGVLGRVHLLKMSDGSLKARAVEVVPVTQMHIRTEKMAPKKATDRIHALNYLARKLPQGAEGLQFTPQKDGTGLYCFEGAAKDPGSIGKLCRSWKRPGGTPSFLAGKIANSCVK